MVQIFGERGCLELILDEPPEALEKTWREDRMKFYRKIEPKETKRNVLPKIFNTPCIRVRYSGVASDAIWAHIYSSSSVDACTAIDDIVRKQALGLYGPRERG